MGKTMEELFKEIKASDKLMREARKLRTEDEIADFLKRNDCDVSVAEAIVYFDKHSALGRGYIISH